LNWANANKADAQDPLKFAAAQSEIRATMPEEYQKFIPAETQPMSQIQEGLKRGKLIQSWFATEKKDTLSKWQYEQALIERKHKSPDKWTSLDQEKLDAVQREPGFPIPQTTPTAQLEAKQFLDALEYQGIPLKGNIENEKEYRARLNSRANEIWGERKKSRNPISKAAAFDQAYQESIERGELETSDILYETTGMRNPLGKHYKYNPNAGKYLEEGMSEARMKASLSKNGLEDTPENRERINKKYREQAGNR
jgi:hypothetical protein